MSTKSNLLIQQMNLICLSSGLDNYKINHILCDAHWNQNGHKIIAKNILKNLNM